jgi:hypothetical protein
MSDHPTIEATEPNTERRLVATWGFYDDDQTAALFVGGDPSGDMPILLPRPFLEALVGGDMTAARDKWRDIAAGLAEKLEFVLGRLSPDGWQDARAVLAEFQAAAEADDPIGES